MRFWPPFWGAGIKVARFSKDYQCIEVQMKLRFWNENYVGTHFGGSLYAMTDPFYMLILVIALGKDYIVWDKSAIIRYKKPAKGTVYCKFEISPEQIESLRKTLEMEKKVEPEFTIPIIDEEGSVVAEVQKVLYVSKREHKKVD